MEGYKFKTIWYDRYFRFLLARWNRVDFVNKKVVFFDGYIYYPIF